MDGQRGAPARVLVVEHEADVGLGRLAQLWGSRLVLDVRRPGSSVAAASWLPDSLDGVDGLVVLGGRPAAWEDERAPHLPRTRALMVEAVERGVPTLGICLGAQLLALATGGRVERGARGVEVGVCRVRPLAAAGDDPLLGALLRGHSDPLLDPVLNVGLNPPLEPLVREGTFWAAQAHGDAVTALPPGALALATGDTYPVQAFRVGASAWGVQYHPEVTAPTYRGWLAEHTSDLAAPGEDLSQALANALAQAQRREAELARLAAAHAGVFADLVEAHAASVSR